MNRAFKTEFHGSSDGLKTIVTMSVTVNNGKLFKSMTDQQKGWLLDHLDTFVKQVKSFREDIYESITPL